MQTGPWQQVAQRHFEVPVTIASFEEFEQRMMRPTFADHHIDDAKREQVRAAFMPHLRSDGAHFMRPMHVRLLQRT